MHLDETAGKPLLTWFLQAIFKIPKDSCYRDAFLMYKLAEEQFLTY
jgi:hypothetical protein